MIRGIFRGPGTCRNCNGIWRVLIGDCVMNLFRDLYTCLERARACKRLPPGWVLLGRFSEGSL